jgi:tetratricopeptide (TPR) repeat protein
VNSGCTSDVEDRCQQLCKNGQYEQAFPVCSKAAEQGDAAAQFNLGLMYYFGEGVQQDYAEAEKWYRKAAEQGDASAEYNLGWVTVAFTFIARMLQPRPHLRNITYSAGSFPYRA